MSITNSIIETLENRTLMSASVLSVPVETDEVQVAADLLKFRTDCLAKTTTMSSDIATIKSDAKPADAVTITPLVKQFRTDMSTMRANLLADRIAQANSVLTDESKIVGEMKQMLADKVNATALAADKTQLKTDRIQLQNDMIAGLNARLTTRQNAYNSIAADCQAIVTAVTNDTGASTKLVADVTQFAIDRTSTLTTLSGDLQKIMGDRQQLVTDLTASQG